MYIYKYIHNLCNLLSFKSFKSKCCLFTKFQFSSNTNVLNVWSCPWVCSGTRSMVSGRNSTTAVNNWKETLVHRWNMLKGQKRCFLNHFLIFPSFLHLPSSFYCVFWAGSRVLCLATGKKQHCKHLSSSFLHLSSATIEVSCPGNVLLETNRFWWVPWAGEFWEYSADAWQSETSDIRHHAIGCVPFTMLNPVELW